MTFDYELCMNRDGGKAMHGRMKVEVLNSGFCHCGEWLYPVKTPCGRVCIARSSDLSNLEPPKPELKPVDVVWWDDGRTGFLAAGSTKTNRELLRITVDPNAMTAGGLAGHGVYILPEILDGTPAWRFQKPAVFTSDGYSSHDEACRAATEWLRKKGEIE